MFGLKLSKDTSNKLNRLLDNAILALERQNVPTRGGVFPLTSNPASKEDSEWVDAYLKQIDVQIKQQAEALVREQVREMMLLGGNFARIKEFLKKGGVPKLVRKKEGSRDPLFLQLGDGVSTPIEEIYILG